MMNSGVMDSGVMDSGAKDSGSKDSAVRYSITKDNITKDPNKTDPYVRWTRIDLDPSMDVSVIQTSPNTWLLGTMYRVDKLASNAAMPEEAISTWTGEDGARFSLQKHDSWPNFPPASASTLEKWVKNKNTWLLGNVVCKVSTWHPDYEPEFKTLAFVADTVPSVPVPKLIHGWVDEALRRSYVLESRVPGTTLQDAHFTMTTAQLVRIADQVATHARALYKIKSPRLQTPTGKSIHGQHMWGDQFTRYKDPAFFLMNGRPLPTWNFEEFIEFLRSRGLYGEQEGLVAPEDFTERMFAFAHEYYNPTNIMVKIDSDRVEDANITAIIDWDKAAFFPWFFPNYGVHNSYWLGMESDGKLHGLWSVLLSKSLARAGLKRANEDWQTKISRDGVARSRAVKELESDITL